MISLELAKLDHNWIIFAVFFTVGIILLEVFFTLKNKSHKFTGDFFQKSSIQHLELFSERLNLAGTPDLVVTENGIKIPVEFKPSSDKVKYRHIIQIIVYLKLIEDIYGYKPEFGYLILGKNKRVVKIKNSQERQDKVDALLIKMKEILDEKRKAIAEPEKNKCNNCPTKNFCSFKV